MMHDAYEHAASCPYWRSLGIFLSGHALYGVDQKFLLPVCLFCQLPRWLMLVGGFPMYHIGSS
jgi:hypothetical protein